MPEKTLERIKRLKQTEGTLLDAFDLVRQFPEKDKEKALEWNRWVRSEAMKLPSAEMYNLLFKTYLFGEGAFLTTNKTNYEKPYYTDYDPETNAGVQKLYTKQGFVLHPNGLSLLADNIVKESPSVAELGNKANYNLRFNPKNVKMGVILTNG
jgi:hypothetical protein